MLSNGLNRLPISFSVKDNKLIPYVDLDFSDIKNELINNNWSQM